MARGEESAATRNLRRTAAKTADSLLRLVRQAIRDADQAVADALAKPAGLTEPGRAEANAQVDALFRKTLKAKMEAALATLASKAAEGGNAEARRQAEAAGQELPRFSEDYLRDYLARVSPANAPGLAAVFTQNLAAGQKAALRAAVVETFRSAAIAGLTTRERMKLLQENWALRAGDTQGARFVDRAGRRWENARYVQMLARTTAQRVQTAAFCDSMLQGGYPLARISNDSGSRDCGVCAAWEGRLIDLTAKNEFRKYGAVPLRAAREAGVFHPNCTHRLEYLSPTEYPKGAYEAFAGRVGEPGAFGDPLKTNALNETAASAKKRAAQAAQAAKEKAKREAEEEAAADHGPIGKTGTWDSLGLPPGENLGTEPAPRKITVAEGERRLKAVEEVTNPLKHTISFGELAYDHIGAKKRRDSKPGSKPREKYDDRMEMLDYAKATILNPNEIWHDTDTPDTDVYVKFFHEPEGRLVLYVVTKQETEVFSWHANRKRFDYWRKGRLRYTTQGRS